MRRILILFLFLFTITNAQEEDVRISEGEIKDAFNKLFNGLSISGQWFLSYQNGEFNSEKYNEFLLKRGYLTIEKKFSDRISARVTQDIAVDRDGDGEGDIELRLKYLFIRYSFDNFGFFTKPQIEFGLVRRAWLDFEQKINRYRLQGTMFLERYRLTSSADYGVIFLTNFGGSVDQEFQKNVNSNYNGKFGSFALGVFNGGGYHAIEYNNNKAIEGRLSLRPLPNLFPGLQFSYNGLWGKGNTAAQPDYYINAGFVSVETERGVLTGQYYKGKGFENGTSVDAMGNSYEQDGYSIFGELKIHEINTSLIGRYDRFNQDRISMISKKEGFIGGIAYYFLGKNKLFLGYDRRNDINLGTKDYEFFEFAVELRF